MTIRERLAVALEARGCRIVEKTKRRWKLARPDSMKFYFIGQSGALRSGRTFSGAVSLTDSPAYRRLLGKE